MIDGTMAGRITSQIAFLLLLAGCGGGSAGRYDCRSASEALDQICDAFNSGAGPLQFEISEEFGPSNTSGEISSEGSGAGEGLRTQGHLTIDIDPQSDDLYLGGIHIEVSDFLKGVG